MLDAYERISEELNQAPWFGRTPDLTRMDALLDELGLPQANTKNIIVTGTDGKGSVCSYLHSILGRRYKVGRFISPHLEEWTERITVGKDDISKEDFARLYVKVMEGAKKLVVSVVRCLLFLSACLPWHCFTLKSRALSGTS